MRLSLMGFLAAMLCPVQTILQACIADILAVLDRDPACESVVQCMLNFKGFQALQCYRIAHWLWRQGRKVSIDCI